MLKIIVINPYVVDFKLYDEWMHPLGLYFLIKLLKNNGHELFFFNCLEQNTATSKKFSTGKFDSIEIEKPELYKDINRKYKRYGKPLSDLTAFLNSVPYPDLICVGSMMTYWAPGVLKTVEVIQAIFPEIPVIIGGIAAQLLPDYFKSNINNCFLPGPLLNINKESLLFPLTKQLSQNDSLIDALSLVNNPHGALLLSLGCPLLCSYCASKFLQPAFILRSIDAIIQEIEYLVSKKGIIDFAFYDDALLFKPQQSILPLLDYIKKQGFKLRFHTPNGLHLRFTNESLVIRLKDAGFRTLRFGYESSAGKHKIDTCGKIMRNEVAQKISIIKKCGFISSEIGIYIMAGLKDQRPQEVMEEMDFIGSLGINVKPVFLSPVPGTALFEYYANQFPLLRKDPLWHNDSFFITKLPGWDSEKIEEIRLKARKLNAAQIESSVKSTS